MGTEAGWREAGPAKPASPVAGQLRAAPAKPGRSATAACAGDRHSSSRSRGGSPLVSLGLALLVLTAGGLLGIGFGRPAGREVATPGAYRQTGHFSYGAVLTRNSPLYPSGQVAAGEPLYLDLVRSIELGFAYRFESRTPHRLTGSIALRALLSSKTDNWHEVLVLSRPARFVGDRASVSASITSGRLLGLISALASQSGVPGASYSAEIQPVVRVAGSAAGHRLASVFSPGLPLAITNHEASLLLADPLLPAGASYGAPSEASLVSAALNPVRAGSLPEAAPDVVAVGRFSLPVWLLRALGVLLAGLAALALAASVARRRRPRATSEEAAVARRLRVAVFPLARLERTRRDLLEVESFPDLARLARYLDRPILMTEAGDGRLFAVDDEAVRYWYRAAPSSPPGEGGGEPRRQGSGRAAESGARRVPPGTLRGVGVLLAALLAASLTTALTAGTTVPASNAGAAVNSLQVPELAPSGCGGLGLGSIVAGSGTIDVSQSNALVLGSAGADTITSTGGYNCIVGGGGNDAVMGASSDVCVTGAQLQNSGPCPPLSNGVTVTASSTSTGPKKKTEQLTIANTSLVTALTVTVKVAVTAGLRYSGQSNSFPKGTLSQSYSTSGGYLTYSWVLSAGRSLPAGSSGLVDAIFSATGHLVSSDSWTVTSTSGGLTLTSSGTF